MWLNESCFHDGHGRVGEKGWDATNVRVVSCAVLRAKSSTSAHEEMPENDAGSGKQILFMNTHLDDQGDVSRKHSAFALDMKAYALGCIYQLAGVVLGGDLNSEVNEEAYQILTDKERYGGGYIDSRDAEGSEDSYGEENTFTGFDADGDGEGCQRIDFVFTNQAWKNCNKVVGYAVLPNASEDKKLGRMSDHRAVVVDLVV